MKYFAIIDGEQKGPFELNRLADEGVRPDTYVWCKGMADWEKAEDVADICRMFRNRLYDLMHPSPDAKDITSPNESESIKDKREDHGTPPPYPTRFDRYLSDSSAHIPSLEEIDTMENKDVPPANVLPLAIIATLLFFPPSGIAAIYFSIKSKQLWKSGLHEEAHSYCRSAKMWTGITFCLGLIFYAFLIRFN